MILLDTSVVLEILFGGEEAMDLSFFLDVESQKGHEIILLNMPMQEATTVIMEGHKTTRATGPERNLENDLLTLFSFQPYQITDDCSPDILIESAYIRLGYPLNMVDAYLIANAQKRQAEILTMDKKILSYEPGKSKIRKVTKRFSAVKWR